MSEQRTVHCATHGDSAFRFVCVHVAQASDTGVPVGFFWDESEEPYLAWCAECDSWSDRAEEFKQKAQFVMFCAPCYDLAKKRLYEACK
jgi:hypothetical protein